MHKERGARNHDRLSDAFAMWQWPKAAEVGTQPRFGDPLLMAIVLPTPSRDRGAGAESDIGFLRVDSLIGGGSFQSE
jgi:hypothetical protein